MMRELLEGALAVGALATFAYGIISMRGGVREFKDAVTELSKKLDAWIEKFSGKTDSLQDRMTAQEIRCKERTESGKCNGGCHGTEATKQ